MFAPNFSFEQEQQFFLDIQQSIENKGFDRLIISQYKGEQVELEKMTFRVIELQGQATLSCLYHHTTQDITKNYTIAEGLEKIAELLQLSKQANLFSLDQDIQLKKNKKKAMLNHQKKQATMLKVEQQQHDREKQRYVQQHSPFLKHLGIADEKGQIVPSMARKWKQINKFIEIFSHAYEQIDATQQELNIVDFGSGKAYLTFALYDYLQAQQFLNKYKNGTLITGIESRKFYQDKQTLSAKVNPYGGFYDNLAAQKKYISLFKDIQRKHSFTKSVPRFIWYAIKNLNSNSAKKKYIKQNKNFVNKISINLTVFSP